MNRIGSCVMLLLVLLGTEAGWSQELSLTLTRLREQPAKSGTLVKETRVETWRPSETAVIVCDVWDLHHCLNAVRRVEEFAPRLNEVLKDARQRGAVIIHAPSDCMPAYADHPARKRAVAAPKAAHQPLDIGSWCLRIPSEEQAAYPIDQSDGGEDDDPQEHATWAAKLKAMGRNPGTPWKTQSSLLDIDSQRDYISDRGDEVWNILEQRGIRNVILTGVHTNMCVLGRPFGLRQMVRNGKNVVLMRDMTDCMYNPKRWPYVDHFTGNDLVLAHIERFVCPTITSDQLLGGKPHRFRLDTRTIRDDLVVPAHTRLTRELLQKDWTAVAVPETWGACTRGGLTEYNGVAWYRSTVRAPSRWLPEGDLVLTLPVTTIDAAPRAWLNGQSLTSQSTGTEKQATFRIPRSLLNGDDANLLVVRLESRGERSWLAAPTLTGKTPLSLKGRWQVRLGDDTSWSNIPLPAKFGTSTDIVYEP